MKIKTSGFTKEEEEKFDKMFLEDAYAKNLNNLETELKRSDARPLTSGIREDIIEGKTTPGDLLEKYAINGDVKKMVYPKLSRYVQKIREAYMKRGVDAGREDSLPGYLDRFTNNLKKK